MPFRQFLQSCRLRIAQLRRQNRFFNRFVVASNGVPVFEMEPINRVRPIHLGSMHWKLRIPAPGITEMSELAQVFRFAQVDVTGESGIIVDHQRTAWISSERSASFMRQRQGKILAGASQKLSGSVVSLAARNSSHNYFHWMTDVLPRLLMLEKAGCRVNMFQHILVSNCGHRFQQETLAQFGIPLDRCVSLEQVKSVQVDELVWPAEPCLSGNVPIWIVEFLRKSFQGWMTPDPHAPKRIFIGRKPGGKRQLLNQVEVQSHLERQGIITYYLDDLSVQAQVSLFFNAELIVAVHGAALTNLVFCQPRTSVIELFSINYVNQCYWTLASHAGMRYGYLLGEGVDKTTPENHLIDEHFTVSTIAIDQLISQMKSESLS